MSFAALVLRGALAPTMTCIARLRLDAQLCTPVPPRRLGTNGRPRAKGERLTLPATVHAAMTTRWPHLTIPGWYG